MTVRTGGTGGTGRRGGTGKEPHEEQAERPLVGVVMGSDSDWTVMAAAAEALDELGVPYEVRVVSAHRTPHGMISYGEAAAGRGLRVLVAGAGGAAHLPGMLASVTPLPVVGVPVPLRHLDGLDSLLSIVQMPAGVPVATVGVGAARNAGLLAARILATGDDALRARLQAFASALADSARDKDAALQERVRQDGVGQSDVVEVQPGQGRPSAR